MVPFPRRKTGLLLFGSKDGPELKEYEKALRNSNITNFKVYHTKGEMEKDFGKYFRNVSEMSAMYDPDGGILLADKCLRALWVMQ